ncbi:hypothetical protein BpHYR1_054183 [Brachionus plicatilis]|uniref:Uncharacterized protein n=1 Tax=Brachionus plicatilis TaxID=10195 RepID=A0A3M7P410_BRAPC|nr:hypothetical protein BpHYR1_054183 [Brachionus plicatilis]
MLVAQIAITCKINLNDSGRKRCRTNLLDSSNFSTHSANDSYTTEEEARTPLDNDDPEFVQSKSSKRFTLFKSKTILAVRADQCSFFLFKACHTIYEDLKKCKIKWLEEIDQYQMPVQYRFGYVD